jgi:hypothetical protein
MSKILNGVQWPYRITVHELKTGNMDTVEDWLDQNVGVFREQWNTVYFYNYSDFYFRDAGHATLFALRWT